RALERKIYYNDEPNVEGITLKFKTGQLIFNVVGNEIARVVRVWAPADDGISDGRVQVFPYVIAPVGRPEEESQIAYEDNLGLIKQEDALAEIIRERILKSPVGFMTTKDIVADLAQLEYVEKDIRDCIADMMTKKLLMRQGLPTAGKVRVNMDKLSPAGMFVES
ncbi:hypothetical protein TeGR_g2001, partial [Tetraparma gracilis]